MTAYNVVRFRVKPGLEEQFIEAHRRSITPFKGFLGADLVKIGDRNYCFVKITKGPAPKMVVVRGPGNDDSCAYYGPFQGTVRVGEALRELNDVLGLRDCSLDQSPS